MKTIKRTLLTIETDPLCIRDLQQGGLPMCSELLVRIAQQLTEAIHQFSDPRVLEIQLVNILHREVNPDGDIIYFRVLEQEPPCK